MLPELIGYSDRLSVAPGETIRFMVSTDQSHYDAAVVRMIHADSNPEGPGYKETVVQSPINRRFIGRKQTAYCGSYALIDHHPVLDVLNGLTIQTWIYPTTPHKGQPQGIVTHWSQADKRGWGLYIGEQGDVGLWLGDANTVERIYTGAPLHSHRWYFVAATFDPSLQQVVIYQKPLINYPHDKSAVIVERKTTCNAVAVTSSPLLIAAAYSETVASGRVVGRDVYNGKIDNPHIFSRVLTQSEIDGLRSGSAPDAVAEDALLASWDFANNFDNDNIVDTGQHQLSGVVINMPMRAVTGHDWDCTEFDFRKTPEQYGAIYFHDDDLEDAGWEADFDWTVPDGTKSGFYAAQLRSGDLEDYISFFVRPRKGTATAKAAYLIPTLTYMAYANDRMRSFDEHAAGITARTVVKDPLDLYLAEHPEFAGSIYDIHSDGSGYCYSSRLRPIMAMRPKYRFWIVGAPRHYAADLYLADWLEHKGIEYDVITDEDLHNEGESLLAHYEVVMTGTHPEYWTTPMLGALETYLGEGGRLMYLGGNGFYWVTSIDPTRPQIVEIRRGTSGTRAWNSAPGEAFHSTSGEMGGLWRHRGKTPNQLVGVAFAAQGWEGIAPGYTRQPGSFDPRTEFIFEGVGKDEIIGDFGLALGGAAGDELDRADYGLGTPAHALVLATSSGHNHFVLPCIEDCTEVSAGVVLGKTNTVHADIVYFETPNQGAVFSTGSITWCGSLSHNHYDNNVSRITENVLRRFLS